MGSCWGIARQLAITQHLKLMEAHEIAKESARKVPKSFRIELKRSDGKDWAAEAVPRLGYGLNVARLKARFVRF